MSVCLAVFVCCLFFSLLFVFLLAGLLACWLECLNGRSFGSLFICLLVLFAFVCWICALVKLLVIPKLEAVIFL